MIILPQIIIKVLWNFLSRSNIQNFGLGSSHHHRLISARLLQNWFFLMKETKLDQEDFSNCEPGMQEHKTEDFQLKFTENEKLAKIKRNTTKTSCI